MLAAPTLSFDLSAKRLTGLRGVGVQTATVLVREGFVRHFRSAKALGSYAGLVGTRFASGGFTMNRGSQNLVTGGCEQLSSNWRGSGFAISPAAR